MVSQIPTCDRRSGRSTETVGERAPVLMQSGNGKARIARIKFGLVQSRVLTALILSPASWVWEKGHDSLWPLPNNFGDSDIRKTDMSSKGEVSATEKPQIVG